jgi:hypothetical protein
MTAHSSIPNKTWADGRHTEFDITAIITEKNEYKWQTGKYHTTHWVTVKRGNKTLYCTPLLEWQAHLDHIQEKIYDATADAIADIVE